MKDREDIPPEQTENLANYDIASSQQTESVEADTVEPKTSSTPTETSSPGSDQPRSKKWLVFLAILVLLVFINPATGIIVVPTLYRTYAAVQSVTIQPLPHVKTADHPLPAPTPLP